MICFVKFDEKLDNINKNKIIYIILHKISFIIPIHVQILYILNKSIHFFEEYLTLDL